MATQAERIEVLENQVAELQSMVNNILGGNLQGPPGPPGPIGRTGEQGPPGPPGRDATPNDSDLS